MTDLFECNTRFRSRLLVTTSVLVLLVGIPVGNASASDSTDRPRFWIELGAQYDQDVLTQEPYSPPFFNLISQTDFTVPTQFENKLPWSFGTDAGVTYQPAGSDWQLSASIRYGRSQSHRHVHQQDEKVYAPPPFSTFLGVFAQRYADTVADNRESHTVVDFTVGRDVGLGLFGHESESVASIGLRYAQFTSRSTVKSLSDPDFEWVQGTLYFPPFSAYVPYQRYHAFTGEMNAVRSFTGIGPEVSWKSHLPITGDAKSGHVGLDWGVNAGLLIGRQKANVEHKTSALRYDHAKYVRPDYQHSPAPVSRTKSVIVPNVGGFVGTSLNWPNAQIALGYRVDIFFGATDGGIDVRKNENRSFYGPFASIRLGLSPNF